MVYLKNTKDEIIYRFATELEESGESEWPVEIEETTKGLELTPEKIEEMISNDPIHAAIDLQIHHLPQYKHYALPLLKAIIETKLPIQPGSSLYSEIEYITNLLSQEQATKD